MFCIFKLLTGITFGAMSFSVNVIQYQTKDLHEQSTVANDSALALISSSALSILIAGSFADAFGNHSIYIFTAIVCMLFIVASYWFIPKKIYFSDKKSFVKNNTNSSTKSLLKFIFSPSMIAILLCTCFVSAIAYQYNSILFLLYADEAGLTKSQIGNITMICICIVFFINNILKKFFINKKQIFIVILAMLCFAVPLLCFALNQSIIWASITLIFVTFAYRTIVVSQKLIWVPLAKKENMPQNKIYMIVIQVKMISTAIAPSIFMIIMSLGANQAAFVVGLICLVALIISSFLTKYCNN